MSIDVTLVSAAIKAALVKRADGDAEALAEVNQLVDDLVSEIVGANVRIALAEQVLHRSSMGCVDLILQEHLSTSVVPPPELIDAGTPVTTT